MLASVRTGGDAGTAEGCPQSERVDLRAHGPSGTSRIWGRRERFAVCLRIGSASPSPRNFVMPFPITQREKAALSVMAVLIVLGLIGMAVL